MVYQGFSTCRAKGNTNTVQKRIIKKIGKAGVFPGRRKESVTLLTSPWSMLGPVGRAFRVFSTVSLSYATNITNRTHAPPLCNPTQPNHLLPLSTLSAYQIFFFSLFTLAFMHARRKEEAHRLCL